MATKKYPNVKEVKLRVSYAPAEAHGWRVDVYAWNPTTHASNTVSTKWFKTEAEAKRNFKRIGKIPATRSK